MELCSLGWRPDVQDLRDFVLHVELENSGLPTAVDLREHELEPSVERDTMPLHMSCATSLLKMLNWQSKKWEGRRLEGTAEFLHRLTVKVWGGGGSEGVGHRATLKTLKQFGSPPKRLCCRDSGLPLLQRPELFSFSRCFSLIEYSRLDSWEKSTGESVQTMRYWLSHGNPFLIGFSVPHSISPSSVSIPFDSLRGGTMGGTSCVVMGYDDEFPVLDRLNRRQPSHRSAGAFLIQTCWGQHWGDQGYVWLPYTFVENRFACDAWVVKSPEQEKNQHDLFI